MTQIKGIRMLNRRDFLKLGGASQAGAALLGAAAARKRPMASRSSWPTKSSTACWTFAPEKTDIIPALAEEVPEPEEDGRRYTFKLREGVTFHGEEPFNAEAVVFN